MLFQVSLLDYFTVKLADYVKFYQMIESNVWIIQTVAKFLLIWQKLLADYDLIWTEVALSEYEIRCWMKP